MDSAGVVFIEELVYQLMTRDPHDKPSADHVRATLHSALPQIKCKSSPHSETDSIFSLAVFLSIHRVLWYLGLLLLQY